MHGVFISLCNMSNNLDEMENITHPTENNNFCGVAFDIYHYNLDGMENINSSIENNNTVNLDQHKSPFFGSLYFIPPPKV